MYRFLTETLSQNIQDEQLRKTLNINDQTYAKQTI